MARPIKTNDTTTNLKVVQSYIMTNARYNFNITEKRILYRLIEVAQNEIKGLLLKDNMCRIQHNLRNVSITMPYASILDIAGPGSGNNHDDVKRAARSLATKLVEVEDTANKMYWCSSIINNVCLDGRKGEISFDVANFIWSAILDFSKGFRQYELTTAMKLRTPYAMRFYELMSGQKLPYPMPHKTEKGIEIDYATLDELRELFGVKGKYKKAADFYKRIIEPSKAELDMSSPYSFNVKEVKEGRKIVGYKFFPTYNQAIEDPALYESKMQAKISGSFLLTKEVNEYLKYSFEFDSKEINRNKKTLIEGQNHIPDFIGFLAELKNGARLAENPKGYVIGAIKRKVKEIEATTKARENTDQAEKSDSLAKGLAEKMRVK